MRARLAPTGSTLDVTDEAIRADHAAGTARFRALISAPAEAQVTEKVDGLRWFHLDHRELLDTAPDPDSTEVLDGRVLPVLTLVGAGQRTGQSTNNQDVCPACGVADGVRFMGSAVAATLGHVVEPVRGQDP